MADYIKETKNMAKRKEMATIHVIEAVDRAFAKYVANYINVCINEETENLDVMYCSENNSFPIESNVANKADIDFRILEKGLDARNVGYVW